MDIERDKNYERINFHRMFSKCQWLNCLLAVNFYFPALQGLEGRLESWGKLIMKYPWGRFPLERIFQRIRTRIRQVCIHSEEFAANSAGVESRLKQVLCSYWSTETKDDIPASLTLVLFMAISRENCNRWCWRRFVGRQARSHMPMQGPRRICPKKKQRLSRGLLWCLSLTTVHWYGCFTIGVLTQNSRKSTTNSISRSDIQFWRTVNYR